MSITTNKFIKLLLIIGFLTASFQTFIMSSCASDVQASNMLSVRYRGPYAMEDAYGSVKAESTTNEEADTLVCASDLNKDGIVDVKDLAIFTKHYQEEQSNCRYDIIGADCELNLLDLAVFVDVYGEICDKHL